MSTVLPEKKAAIHLTVKEFLALPNLHKRDVMLINGLLLEKKMTLRNRNHSKYTSRISQLIGNWIDTQNSPRGEVFDGEAGVILSEEFEDVVGIDVVYFSAEVMAKQTEDTTLLVGVPILVVEILSPSDKHKEVIVKVDAYLRAGVPHIWVVDPDMETVMHYQPKHLPESFNVSQSISCEPEMLGFIVPVQKIFQR